MSDILFRETLSSGFFKHNRQRLARYLNNQSLALLVSGKAPAKTADEFYPFFANRSFYYLTGIDQEESALMLMKVNDSVEEILFIQDRDELKERWTGAMVGRDDAKAVSGCSDVRGMESFHALVEKWIESRSGDLYIDFSASNQQADSLKHWLGRHHDKRRMKDVSPILTELRMIKQPEEIAAMKKAISLTGEGIQAMADTIRPGAYEFEASSAFKAKLAEQGILDTAFPSIVAAGKNSLCLHHMKPYGVIAPGDLVQLDVGAAVAGVCADISRVIPADGHFTEKQKHIYRIVRQCQETAFNMIKPDRCLNEINLACQEAARNGLIKIGLLDEQGSVKDYFWHSVSHHLGFDVHDVSKKEVPLRPGMVITVEPGVYIKQWQIGIRLEDDVLVTDTGCEILSADIPRELPDYEN